MKRELAARRAARELKYNPNWAAQPRAPRGAPDGGQWVDGGGGGGDRSGAPKQDRPRVPLRPRVVNLLEEEGGRHFGHTISVHVGRSPQSLLSRVRGDRIRGIFSSIYRSRDGSFPSLAAANRLVNATLAQNRAIVVSVANGVRRGAFITARFGSPTGIEAYARSPNSNPYLRTTYGVAVEIVHDPNALNGFRVVTAYPRND